MGSPPGAARPGRGAARRPARRARPPVEAWNALPADGWNLTGLASMTRTMLDFVWVRRREVEIHHVDLDRRLRTGRLAGRIRGRRARRDLPIRSRTRVERAARWSMSTTGSCRPITIGRGGWSCAARASAIVDGDGGRRSGRRRSGRLGLRCRGVVVRARSRAAAACSRAATSACCAFPAGSRSR